MAKNKPATDGDKKPKKVAPISLDDFAKKAKPVGVAIDGVPMAAIVKAPMSTGSYGWNLTNKSVITVDGVAVPVQIGMNITVIGSKPEAK